jgi:hypothetical protein
MTEYNKSWFMWHWMMQDAPLTLLCTNGDTSVKVNIHSFHMKRKTLSCSGQNQTVFWVQQKYGTQKDCVPKINHKFSKTIYISLFHLPTTPSTDSESLTRFIKKDC